MYITTPQDKKEKFRIENFIAEFEAQLKVAETDLDSYLLILYEKVSERQCEEIKKIYEKAGWINVTCKCENYFFKNEEYFTTKLILKNT